MSASVKSCQAASAHPQIDLFCVAIDWILDHMGTKPHLEVGGQIFSDLVYADDTAFCSVQKTTSHRVYTAFHRQLDFVGQGLTTKTSYDFS